MDSDRTECPPSAPWHRSRGFRAKASIGGRIPASIVAGWSILGLGLTLQAGCMSALTSTALKEAMKNTAATLAMPHDGDHAAEARIDDVAGESQADNESAVDTPSLESVIDNAVARLSAAGGIDAATQGLLIQTLERTRPEDWPVVVNEFASSLEATRGEAGHSQAVSQADVSTPDTLILGGGLVNDIPGPARMLPMADVASSEIPPAQKFQSSPPPRLLDVAGLDGVAQAPLGGVASPALDRQLDRQLERQLDRQGVTLPVALPLPVAPPAVAEEQSPLLIFPPQAVVQQAVYQKPVAQPVSSAAVIEPLASQKVLAEPPLPEAFDAGLSPAAPAVVGPTVNNACFATRVRGWGVVDRFPEPVFSPGQEVIVYFELDRLATKQSDEGHSTGIDTSFRLLGAGGERIGQWTFDPIVETCRAPRRDYFARYFVRIPEDARPGKHRLEWDVTDRVAGATRQAHLDLEIR